MVNITLNNFFNTEIFIDISSIKIENIDPALYHKKKKKNFLADLKSR